MSLVVQYVFVFSIHLWLFNMSLVVQYVFGFSMSTVKLSIYWYVFGFSMSLVFQYLL